MLLDTFIWNENLPINLWKEILHLTVGHLPTFI